MAKIKTIDYEGNCRRNGGKLKLAVSDYIKILTTFFILFTGVIIFYDRTSIGMVALADDSKECKAKNDEQDLQIATIVAKIDTFGTNMKDFNNTVKDFSDNMGDLKASIGRIEGWIGAKVNEESRVYRPSIAGDRPNIRE